MATPIQQLMGTAAEVAAKTYAQGLLIWNETAKRFHGGDGVTPGGIPMARLDELNTGSLGYAQRLETGASNTVTAADSGKVIIGNRATAIAFNLQAANDLTSKFVVAFKNIGVGTMTVVPNGTDVIDGVNAALTVPSGSSVIVKGDGASFRTFLSNGDIAALVDALATKQDASALSFGQCRLSLSGGNLRLSRFGGRLLTINGQHYSIPSSGPTLSASGLTPSTLYFIYAYMDAGTMKLEASTTAHATDGTTGVEIKSGDATRTLVGMARPITGPAWADSVTQRFVRSWFNRKPEAIRKAFTAVRSVTSTSFTEVNSEIRCEWLQWADEVPTAHIQGATQNSASNVATNTAIGWDGTADANTANSTASSTGIYYNCSTSAPKEGLGEGYHYATVMGSVTSASTGFWGSSISGSFTSLSVSVG